MVNRAVHHPRAFALIDVIVGCIILAVGLGAVISLSGRAVRAGQQGEILSTAAMLADEQLALVLARGPDDFAQRFPVQGQCDEPFAQYAYRLDITGGRSAGEVYQVSATITWGGASANSPTNPAAASSNSLSIQTLLAPRTIGIDAETEPDRRPAQTLDRGSGVGGGEGAQ